MRNAAVALAIALALMSAPEVDANSAVTVLHRSDSGQPRYVRFDGITAPGAGVLNKTATVAQAEQLKQFIAPIQGLDGSASHALGEARIETLRSGATRYSWQQAFDGVPVLHGRLTALVDDAARLRMVSGEPAAQAPIRRHSKAPAQAARLLSLAAAALETRAPSVTTWRAAGPELHWHSSSGPVRDVRAMPVYAKQGTALLPAWSYEIAVSSGERSSRLWQIVLSDQGELLLRRSLTRDASFSYRVYGHDANHPDNALRPIDSPYGDLTPLPAGELTPTYISANDLSIEELATSHSNPWLPEGATTLTGHHAEVYLDISGADGFNTGDRRGPISAAGQFHWTFDGNADVRSSASNQNAAMTQAFYVVNWLHDYFHDAGFTTGTATGANRMLVEIQDFDGSNNANMTVPASASPRMQVFLFDGPTESSVTVSGAVTGSYVSGHASFGPDNFTTSGELVVMQDGAGLSPTDGCETLTNAAALNGKIALVDRGNCNFIDKVERAQSAGALAVLVANNTSGTLTMGLPDGNTTVINIGALLISQDDGNAIKSAMAGGSVNAALSRNTATPIDGALDSALVAHEWGHYLTNRIMDIGNASQANGMDEGWSDFVAMLALSAASDAGNWSGSYGFSGYAVNDFGNGLRRFPYSSDPDSNALSFRHISNGVVLPNGGSGSNNSEVHNTGEIWASALWDAYVNLLRNRGYQVAQSRMREYLVQGMKNTAVFEPDFIEARDAQLDAVAALQPNETPNDLALFRQAFARRGLGVNAVAPAKSDDTQANAVESFVWTVTAVPTVNAGADQVVIQGAVVNLTGIAADSDGAIASYRWRQLSGPTVTLTSNNSADTSFTAPAVALSTSLVFELTVSDTAQEKASDQIVITVSPAENQAPTANAGADQTVTEGATVTVNGTGTDSDGSIASYRWQQLSGPSVALANSAAASTTFTAPSVDSDSSLTLQLTVTDNLGQSASDTVTITVRNSTPPPSSGGGGGGCLALATLALLGLLSRQRRLR